MKTAQEVFDTTLNHLRKQGRAATERGQNGGCRYHTEKGLMCAAGCHIPVALYGPDLERKSIGGSYPRMMSIISDLCLDEHLGLLTDMQRAHDGELRNYGMPAWERKMESIAQQYKLKYEPVTEEAI